MGGLVYFLFSKKLAEQLTKPAEQPIPEEKTLEEKLRDLTAPAGAAPEVPEGTIEDLTAPGGERKFPKTLSDN